MKTDEGQTDPEQLRFDLEDAQDRLAHLAKAIAAKDEAERLVASLSRQLRQARRQLKEATWSLSLAVAPERRRAAAPGTNGNGNGNGKARKGAEHGE